jgi:hypothetical protein
VAGEERDVDQPPTSRVTDRDLLWVESVSERLLGHAAPRAWERAFFRPEPTGQPEYPGQRPEAPAALEPRPEAVRAESRPMSTPRYEARPEAVPPLDQQVAPGPAPTTPEFPVSPPADLGPMPVPAYFTEGDADWRHDLEPEFPDDGEDDVAADVEEPDLVIDLTEPLRPQPPEVPSLPVRIDDEMLRLALRSGDTVLANAVLILLEDRSRDRQHIATLETALRALIEQVDRIDGPDHELAVTARLLRRVVDR